jgi:hypothetical protein
MRVLSPKPAQNSQIDQTLRSTEPLGLNMVQFGSVVYELFCHRAKPGPPSLVA